MPRVNALTNKATATTSSVAMTEVIHSDNMATRPTRSRHRSQDYCTGIIKCA
jgi:hypothetical protein